MQPASVSSAISVSTPPARLRVSAPSGNRRALVQLLGAELQHLDQAGLVEHGVGVGRAHQAGNAAGDGRGHFAFEHAFVLVARLAQARGQVDQAGRDDAARGVDGALGLEAGWRAGTMPILPSAMAMSACLSVPDAGSMTRPLVRRMFMLRYLPRCS
jgi:hypothetical protein